MFLLYILIYITLYLINNQFYKKYSLQVQTFQIQILKPDIQKCNQIFDQIDKNKSGSINKLELQQGLKQLGVNLEMDVLTSIIDIIDDNFNNKIEKDEFQRLFYIIFNSHPDDVKTILFLAADKDYSGSIDLQELTCICKKLEFKLSEFEIKELFQQIADINYNKAISYQQFNKFMQIIINQ